MRNADASVPKPELLFFETFIYS